MKKFLSSLLFCGIVMCLIINLGNVTLPKDRNIIIYNEFNLKDKEDYDVLVFGSCHAYTSFNPLQLWRDYGMTSYNVARPSENIASCYLNMYETLKDRNPKVVLVETWGLQSYETYIEQESIFGAYFYSLLDSLPFSIEKQKIINDFNLLSFTDDNLYITRYKDRIVDRELQEYDFNYESGMSGDEYFDFDFGNNLEMSNRLHNKGYKAYTETNISKEEYTSLTSHVDEDQILPVEDDMMKYLEKIVTLCKEKNIELIFYRAPYVTTDNEQMKINWLSQYFEEKEYEYYNLENLIDFDYDEDFDDMAHLNTYGAVKSTSFLSKKIIQRVDFIDHRNDNNYDQWNKIVQRNDTRNNPEDDN